MTSSNKKIKIGVLTSSRADFGIYLPLLKELESSADFELELIVFGTHLSEEHGSTITEIESYNFPVIHQIPTKHTNDTSEGISNSMGETIVSFSSFWKNHEFDLVVALGDRYEMFAAVSSSVPFVLKVAHIHAGETTLGAIDNAFRHCISSMSDILFTTCDEYTQRAQAIVAKNTPVHNVGALSIDNLVQTDLLSKESFQQKFGIDLNRPTVLCTFHPETVSLEKNETYVQELIQALQEIQNDYQIVITMPNSDTQGQMVRAHIQRYLKENLGVTIGVESFGMLGYLTCMKYCSFMLGNTSSGFVEAAFFPKYVINLGDRQNGRILTPNMRSCIVEKSAILKAVEWVENQPEIEPVSIYGKGNTAQKIVAHLTDFLRS